MSPPSWATAGRTRVSISSLMVATVSASLGAKNSSPRRLRRLLAEDRHAGHEVLHDRAEDRRLDVRPLAVGLGDGDEIAAEEDAADAVDREQPLGERRGRRLVGRAVFGRAGAEHDAAGQELQARRVRRGFGLDEHGVAPFKGALSGLEPSDLGRDGPATSSEAAQAAHAIAAIASSSRWPGTMVIGTGKVPDCLAGERGDQRAGAFLVGAGGEHEDGDVLVRPRSA